MYPLLMIPVCSVALSHLSFFFLLTLPPPTSTLFPYTTLFRSERGYQPSRSTGARERRRFHRNDEDRHSTEDRKSTRLNSSHRCISYAVFCLKKKKYTTPEYSIMTIT